MYGINLLLRFNKSFVVKLRTAVSSLQQIRNASKTKTSFSVKSLVDKDVVIYNFEKPKFFTFLNIFSSVQCVCWSYLGIFLYRLLDRAENEFGDTKTVLSNISVDQRKYLNGLCILSFIFGWSFFLTTGFYSFRSIRKIILHKGGRELTIVTYALPTLNTIKAPLSNISSVQHRTKAKKYVPVKLKDKYFYYLIDISGDFPNPELFDFTAGLQRSF